MVFVVVPVYSFGVTRGFSFRCTNSQDGNGAGTIEKVEGVALVQWDNGFKNICRVGHDAAYDLCIADKAVHKKAKAETVRLADQKRPGEARGLGRSAWLQRGRKRFGRKLWCVNGEVVDFFVSLRKADQDTKLGFGLKEVVDSNITSLQALKIED